MGMRREGGYKSSPHRQGLISKRISFQVFAVGSSTSGIAIRLSDEPVSLKNQEFGTISVTILQGQNYEYESVHPII
jgi:hypothetical protein